MDNPHCPDFKPSPTASWLCAWWDWEHTGPNEVEWFCSRPAWDYRECETRGLRFAVKVGQEEDSFE